MIWESDQDYYLNSLINLVAGIIERSSAVIREALQGQIQGKVLTDPATGALMLKIYFYEIEGEYRKFNTMLTILLPLSTNPDDYFKAVCQFFDKMEAKLKEMGEAEFDWRPNETIPEDYYTTDR